jgi:hypothetical protein
MSTEQAPSIGKRITPPGVYKSDVEGHILILRWSPTSVTCVTCAELCSQADTKSMREFKEKASAFTAKHGYLGERIADKLEDILKTN